MDFYHHRDRFKRQIIKVLEYNTVFLIYLKFKEKKIQNIHN